MKCKFCGKENDDQYVVKIQRRVGKDKENVAEIDSCRLCAAGLLEKAHNQSQRVEGMCCDCEQEVRYSICGDYSENEWCKSRKADGSCWK